MLPAAALRARRGSRRVLALLAAGTLVLGCRSTPPPDSAAVGDQPRGRVLAQLATQPVALLPTQHLRTGDSTGWSAQLGPARGLLDSLDAAIAAELAVRGTARLWIMPQALARSARRNPGFTSDPYELSAESLRHGVRRTNPRLGEPLASQMRSLLALTNARVALIPVELRFEPTTSGARAILRLVLVDARLAEIQWAGDVSMEDALPSGPTIVAALAKRVADLVAEP